jgi:hypothetical protein
MAGSPGSGSSRRGFIAARSIKGLFFNEREKSWLINESRRFVPIIIVRTIDLLFLIRQFEDRTERKEKFLEILGSGGGVVAGHGDRLSGHFLC